MRIFNTFVLSTATYACETWTLRGKEIAQLDTWWMKQLRQIVGVKKEEHVHNATILKKLDTRLLSEIVLERRFCYFGHVSRYPGTRWSHFLTTAELTNVPENKKGTTGTKLNWRKQLEKELQEAKTTNKDFHKRAKKHVYLETFKGMKEEDN